MECFVNYEEEKKRFSIPKEWNVISNQEKPRIPGLSDALREIRRVLDHPIESPRIEELARPGMEVVLLFDDLHRPTPVHLALPEILDRLNQAGIPDERITGICALGTHPPPTLEQLGNKVNKKVLSRLQGRVFPHDPNASDNVIIGILIGAVWWRLTGTSHSPIRSSALENACPILWPGLEEDARLSCQGYAPMVLWLTIILPGCAIDTVG